MPRTRSTPDQMADKKRSILAIIEGAARSGRVCPSLTTLAGLLRLGGNRIHELLNQLRAEKAIKWRIVFRGPTRVRVATITASGLTTALPGPANNLRAKPKQSAKPGPVFIGPPVRDLRQDDPAKFTARKAELEQRDRDERARAQAWS